MQYAQKWEEMGLSEQYEPGFPSVGSFVEGQDGLQTAKLHNRILTAVNYA